MTFLLIIVRTVSLIKDNKYNKFVLTVFGFRLFVDFLTIVYLNTILELITGYKTGRQLKPYLLQYVLVPFCNILLATAFFNSFDRLLDLSNMLFSFKVKYNYLQRYKVFVKQVYITHEIHISPLK